MQTTAENTDGECQQQASWTELPFTILKNIYGFLKRDDQVNMSLECQEWSVKDSQRQVQWTELPLLVLEKIYSFLERDDQVNMSLVCRKWSEGYGSPSVWKIFEFKLTKSHLSMNSWPVMKTVRKYSNFFREVKITCESFSSFAHIRTWGKLFIDFLDILSSSSQLTSVKFEKLENFFMNCDGESNKEVMRSFAKFLKSQHNLKRVEFQECYFFVHDGLELLKILIVNTGKSLNHLVFTDFFNIYNWKVMNEQLHPNTEEKLPRIRNLPKLKTLKTDFSPIFEYLFESHSNDIQKFENFQTYVFSKLILIYSYVFPQDHKSIIRSISSNDWNILTKLFPRLQVELCASSSSSDGEVQFPIVPNMPINHIQYDNYFSVNNMKRFFDHLLACNTDDYLVNLQIKWMFRTKDFGSTLNPFLQSCTKLKCLELTIVDPTIGIHSLMKSWLENRPPSLENVFIHTEKRNHSPGYMILKMAIDELAPRLESIGLKIHLGPSGLSI